MGIVEEITHAISQLPPNASAMKRANACFVLPAMYHKNEATLAASATCLRSPRLRNHR